MQSVWQRKGLLPLRHRIPTSARIAFASSNAKHIRSSWPVLVILGQHQRLLEWLAQQTFVDPQRIGFYGLSYGGKTAVRVPPLLDGYALAICSADFNEWVWKNTSVEAGYSYLVTQEYDMVEFNLANVANYAELAMLMAPRPFMVERGHADGVAPDEWVAYEFAKVRRFYDTHMKIPDRAEIEFFDGPHTINGKGTFEFLHRHRAGPRADRRLPGRSRQSAAWRQTLAPSWAKWSALRLRDAAATPDRTMPAATRTFRE
jgi:hypothetical protein